MSSEDQLSKLRQLNNPKEVVEIQHIIQQQQSAQIQIKSKSHKIPQQDSQGQQQNQHTHGHRHGSQCKHEHGNKQKKTKHHHHKGQKNFGIILYCIFTCLSCFYLEVYCFYPLSENLHQTTIRTFFTYLVVIMCLWSYFQTIYNKNTFLQNRGLPNVTTDLATQSNYLSKQCQHCKYPKPPRVSHCSTCGNCIMKLDHHCIWTQNCIGYRNQRPFYLFTLYMSIGVIQFWLASYQAFFRMYGTCKFFSFFEPGVYILWIITCFSALFVGIMILALLVSHTLMILTNHTTLMSMKLKKVCPIPFCQFRNILMDNQSINAYDRGQIQNIRSLFGTNIFLAFLPLTRQITHDFLFEAPNPIPSKGQLMQLAGGGQAEVQRQQQLRASILRVKQLYKNQKFTLNDQIIVVN